MSSTVSAPDVPATGSAIACAAGTIIGPIKRANSTHIGFSLATVLSPDGGTPPRRTGSVRAAKFYFTSGRKRNRAVVPRYAEDRLLRNDADSGAR